MISWRTVWRSRGRLVRREARRYRGAARKLLTLSPAEWRQLISAQIALLHAQILLWTRPEGKLVTVAPGATVAEPNPAQLPDARRLALAVRRAAAFGVFRPACLVRSIALCRLMESHGIHGGRVEVGVARRQGQFVAHAWVRWGPDILGDEEDYIAEYRPLSQVAVVHNE